MVVTMANMGIMAMSGTWIGGMMKLWHHDKGWSGF